MDEETQPLPVPAELFQRYLQQHHLTIVEAARLIQAPASLIWRMARGLPVRKHIARIMLERLATRLGTRYQGIVVIIQKDQKIRVCRF